MPNKKPGVYHSYILRLWCEPEGNMNHWRFSLEDVDGEQRHGFVSIPLLSLFLAQLTHPEAAQQHLLEEMQDFLNSISKE